MNDFVNEAFPQKIAEKEKSRADLQKLINVALPLLGLAVSLLAILMALLALGRNDLEAYPVPILAGICVVLELMFIDVYRKYERWDFSLLIISILSFVFILALQAMPEYVTGLQLNAIIHRSFFSIVFLLTAGLSTLIPSIYYMLDATPAAEDLSRYALILLPTVLILVLYFILIWQLVSQGSQTLDWSILFKPYYHIYTPEKYYILGDWPAWRQVENLSIGIQNHILGTGLLVLLTSLISMPIGVGTGLFLSEYSSGWLGNFIKFTTGSLRAISLFILGLTAFYLANLANNTPFDWIFRGTYFTGWETVLSSGGSYLTASIILSLLIIPLIARVTEEGSRSLPPDLREGSLALGVSEGTTLRRLVFPWALPNIITGWLLGCSEVTGSVAVLLFIAGRGEYGVGIFKQVTSLAYLIFDIYYGEKSFREYMLPYQFQAGLLLLLITLILGFLAILAKNWLSQKYRGS